MKTSTKPQHQRNSSIVRLRRIGQRPVDIAPHFDVSPVRVSHIFTRGACLEQRRDALRKRYGDRPKIDELSDRAPLDVLILCDTDFPGWVARLRQLQRTSRVVKTLGDLRTMTDEELFRQPRIGMGLLAQLRLFCPFRPRRDSRPLARETDKQTAIRHALLASVARRRNPKQ